MKFIPLPLSYFSQLKNPNDFHNYVDGLALVDDLLCAYDREPRTPMYLPEENNGRAAGDLELINERISECLGALRSPDLHNNLAENFNCAKALHSDAANSPNEIQLFLAALLYHYADVIHPAIYPASQG